ncbi:MFS transporter [Lactiplantibacillus brownii]
MGQVMAITMAPALALNLVAGVLIERTNPKQVMLVTDLLTGLLFVFAALLMVKSTWQIAILAVVSVCNKSIGVFYKLGNKTIVPQLFAPNQIIKVNGFQTQVRQVAIISASMFIASLLIWVSAQTIIFGMGLAFLLSALLDSQFYLRPRRQKKLGTHAKLSPAWRLFRQRSDLRHLTLLAIIGCLVDAVVAVIVPWLVLATWESKLVLSVYLGLEALGIIMAPFVQRWLPRLTVTQLSYGLPLSLGLLIPVAPLLGLGLWLLGLLRGLFNLTFYTHLQTAVSPAFVSRLLAITLVFTDGTAALGAYLAPFLTQWWGRWALIGLGGVLIVATGLVQLKFRHQTTVSILRPED